MFNYLKIFIIIIILSKSDDILIISNDKELRIHNILINGDTISIKKNKPIKQRQPIIKSAFFDKNMILITQQQSTNLLQIHDNLIIKEYSGHADIVTSISVTNILNDKQIATGSYDKSIRVQNANSGALVQSMHGHTASITALQLQSYGDKLYVLSGSDNAEVYLWDFESGSIIVKFNAHVSKIIGVFLVDKFNVVVTASSKIVKIWSIDGQLMHNIKFQSKINCIVVDNLNNIQVSMENQIQRQSINNDLEGVQNFSHAVKSFAISKQYLVVALEEGWLEVYHLFEKNLLQSQKHKSNIDQLIIGENQKL